MQQGQYAEEQVTKQARQTLVRTAAGLRPLRLHSVKELLARTARV